LKTISGEELKEKLDRKDNFQLVMTLGEAAFRMARIPGSINISTMGQAEGLISPDDEIVVYCHDENCPASQAAYQMLVSHGFANVRRFAGGIRAWQEAGYPLESDLDHPSKELKTAALSLPINEEDHIQGRPDAPLVLIVYGDYECPYTRRAMTHVQGLQRRLGDDLCFAYRHFPAPEEIHPHAWIAAEAVLAANAQGKFWDMHWHLFRHQKDLKPEDLEGYALELSLDVARFKQDMSAHVHEPRIKRDQKSGFESGVQGIPTLFINNLYYAGPMRLADLLQAFTTG
jgi:protein-disulfide isomerase/rhodanese-related sulfurtransferase